MVRPAKFGDIPRLVELYIEMYQASPYKGRADLDEKMVKALLVQSIQRHGLKTAGGTCVFVTDEVNGFIVGVLDRIYHIGVQLMGTDLHYYCSSRAEARDARRLFAAFENWAWSNPAVLEVKLGVTDTLGQRSALLGKLYERLGYRRTGEIFERQR